MKPRARQFPRQRAHGVQETQPPTLDGRIAHDYTTPCYTGNMELETCGYYDDWFRADVAQSVLDAVRERPDWEHEVVIAAEALYASEFLSPN